MSTATISSLSIGLKATINEYIDATSSNPLKLFHTINDTIDYNDTIAQTEACPFHATTFNLLLTCIYFIIFCLSVVGNSVVLVIIAQQRWMRTVTNLYLLNL